MRDNFETLMRAGRISQVIYSYNIPILFRVDGVWIRTDDNYSATTGTQHYPKFWSLHARCVPSDATLEDIDRIVAGQMIYIQPRSRDGIGRMIAGKVAA